MGKLIPAITLSYDKPKYNIFIRLDTKTFPMEINSYQLELDKKNYGFLIGKHFKFKERFDDVDFTFVKIIDFTTGGMICDAFARGDICENCVLLGRTIYNFNEIHNMTEIPEKEFSYEVNKLLDIMNLEIKS